MKCSPESSYSLPWPGRDQSEREIKGCRKPNIELWREIRGTKGFPCSCLKAEERRETEEEEGSSLIREGRGKIWGFRWQP